MKKRVIGIFLTLTMLLSLLPTAAFAATVVASGTCGDPEVNNGEDVAWSLNSDGILTINGTGDMKNWSGFDTPWYKNSVDIVSVVICDGVTSIGRYAFSYCNWLTSVTIPGSVKNIGHNAFESCKRLNNVIIQNGVESIGVNAFHDCSTLESISIPNSVTIIRAGAFEECTNIENIFIPSSVTDIEPTAFSSCTRLSAITVDSTNTMFMDVDGVLFREDGTLLHTYPAGKTEQLYTIPDSVTDIGMFAFSHCPVLTSVAIPNSVTMIGSSAFDGCAALMNVSIPNSVTSIAAELFFGCSALSSVTIPNSITSIGTWAFYGCENLTTIAIPESVTSIDNWVFRDNTSLTDIYFGGSQNQWTAAVGSHDLKLADTVTIHYNSIGGGFCGDPEVNNGEDITWSLDSDGVLTLSGMGKMADWENGDVAPWNSHRSDITSAVIENGVTSIGSGAFSYCDVLTSVTIPSSVTSIEGGAFRNCSSLMNVTIPSSVTIIRFDAFAYCSSLTDVTIPSSVTGIWPYAFERCTSLTSVTISEGVTGIGNDAFYDCAALTSVTIPSSVTSIGNDAFACCDELTDIYFSGTEVAWASATRSNNYIGLADSVTIHYGSYTITWLDDDGTTLATTLVPAGETPTYDGETPTKAKSDRYEYTFSEWTPAPATATGDATYTAVYSAATREYMVTFVNWDGTVLATPKSYPYGTKLEDMAQPAENPTKPDVGGHTYAFAGWTESTDTDAGTITYTAQFDANDRYYTITYAFDTTADESGVLATSSEKYDEIPTYPGAADEAGNPIKAANAQYTYNFTGWDKAFDNVAGDTTYTAHFSAELRTYTIRFVDGDGNGFLHEVSYGETPVFSLHPSKSDDAQGNKYVWDGTWKNSAGVVGIQPVTGDETYTAQFTTNFKIDWVNWDNSHLATTYVPTGETPTYSGEQPTRSGYSFTGWTPTVVPATGPTTYTATFTPHSGGGGGATIVASGICGDPSVNDGKNVTWTLDSDGVLTISGTGDMKSWSVNSVRPRPDTPWRSQEENVKTIIIESGVTSIGGAAFSHCSSLTSVTIPNSVSIIGQFAFSECYSLTSVTIPSNVTTIAFHAFAACSSLTAIAVDNGSTSYQDIDGVLFSADGTVLHAYPAGKLSQTYTIPDGVTSISSYAFDYCRHLTGVTMPENVAEIGFGVFYECSYLTSITIPSGVTSIKYETFVGCYSLTSVTIPSSVTSIGRRSFYNTDALTDVYFGGTEEQWNAAIGNNDSFLGKGVTIHYNSLGSVSTKTLVLPDAVKFVPYSQMLEGVDGAVVTFRADAELPAWLSLDAKIGELSGIPTETGTHGVTVTVLADGIEALRYSLTLTVKNNTTTAVTQESATELKIEQTVSNMTTTNLSDQVFEIEDKVEEVKSNFEKFLDVYLDGVKLNGGKVGENETVKTVEDVPDEWEYYAEEGSTKITVRAQTFQKKGSGTHTIAATFSKTDPATGATTGETISAAQNFMITAPTNDNNGGGNGGGGGGSSSPQTPKSETKDNGTIQYTVKDGAAQLDAKSMDKLTESAKNNSVLTLDFTTAGQTMTTVKLPAGMIDKLVKLLTDDTNKAQSLVVKLTSGALTFDAASLAEIAKQAGNAELSLSLTEVEAASLSAQQQEALTAIGAEKVFSIEIKAGDKQITAFGGGRVTIAVPFSVPAERDARGYAVWHLAEDSRTTRHSTAYADGTLSFRTAHFSYYAVAYQEAKSFNDVPNGLWYASDVNHMVSLGLMNGIDGANFAPDMELNRAMVAQILYNLEKAETGASAKFEDVPASAWYADAVNWAAEAGVVDGVGNGKYEPTRAVTRGELIVMLYKYAAYKQYSVSNVAALGQFSDSADLPNWVKSAMQWAVGTKLISGINGKLADNETATRAQTAKVLTYFLEQYET